jgi:NADPH:quinone reductase-like Zn-dependent oxidoreductase
MTGVVERIGPSVTKFEPGQRVWANNQGYNGWQGTFAEYCSIQKDFLYPFRLRLAVIWQRLSTPVLRQWQGYISALESAVARPYSSTAEIGNVSNSVLQLAKARGARAIVTSTNEEKAAWSRELGADLTVNYRREEVALAVRGCKVHVYWDATPVPDASRAV